MDPKTALPGMKLRKKVYDISFGLHRYSIIGLEIELIRLEGDGWIFKVTKFKVVLGILESRWVEPRKSRESTNKIRKFRGWRRVILPERDMRP